MDRTRTTQISTFQTANCAESARTYAATAEEREQRRAAERELVERAVEELRTSAGWQRWLGVRRHFHRYSLRNQIVISMQMSDATHVAGFRAWIRPHPRRPSAPTHLSQGTGRLHI